MFFLMRDCWRERAEPALLLPLEMDVALERDTLSAMVVCGEVVVVGEEEGISGGRA